MGFAWLKPWRHVTMAPMNNDLQQAVAALKAGHAIVFPTDTVYGVGVAVRYAETPGEVFRLKRRNPDKPVAWLVGSVDDLDRYGVDVPEEARCLVTERWPGALTVVVKASESVPLPYQSSRGTIGLRMPANDAALELIRQAGPLATSSANLAGGVAPRAFRDIPVEMRESVAVALQDDDAGQGLPSAVLDFSREEPSTLRE